MKVEGGKHAVRMKGGRVEGVKSIAKMRGQVRREKSGKKLREKQTKGWEGYQKMERMKEG